VQDDLDLKKIVGEVAAAYFSNSHVTVSEIPMVISQIAASLSTVGAAAPAPAAAAEAPAETKLTPAQIRRSISRDAIISFEDNKPYKTLRRHLASKGLTPEQYRTKWGLPGDYPMVSPAYSESRSNLAKALGLGNQGAASRRRAQAEAAAAAPKASAPKAGAPKKRGRPARAAASETVG